MSIIKIPDEKVAVFSDIHWGKNRDNLTKIEISDKFIDFLIAEMTERKLKTVLFLGDFFDNRNYINVQTMFTAYQALKKMCEKFKVYVILGNHDSYFKNSISVHSIKPLSDMENLVVVEQTTDVDFSGRSALFCPWHFDPKPYAKKSYDYMFGHFEFNGASLCGQVFRNGPYDMCDVVEIAPLIFSGHFHIRKEYFFKKGKVIVVGSPYQLDWGDADNEKGFYVLNTQKGTYDFISNSLSPIHIKLPWSTLESWDLSKDKIKGNYVKVVVDQEYDYNKLMEMVEKVNELEPAKCNVEYIFSFNKHLMNSVDTDNDMAQLKMTKLDYIVKYIEKLENFNNIDKNRLCELANQYYRQCEAE